MLTVMSQLSINKFGDNLPVTSIVAFSQAAVGFGLGLLLADSIDKGGRTKAGAALVVGGLLALAPVAAGVITNVKNRPTSSSRMKRQLESIRQGIAHPGNGQQF